MKSPCRLGVLGLHFFILLSCLSAQSRESLLPGGHRGAVTALVTDGDGRILSAGEDGFLEIWDARQKRAIDRFQLSLQGILSLALRPDHREIAVVENAGPGLCRVSAWDYDGKRLLFVRRFRESLQGITYSGGGNYLILRGSTGVHLLDPETGDPRPPEGFSGTVSFAATGKSERTIVLYFSGGVLSYRNLLDGGEVRRLEAPSGITGAALLGNNRFLVGFDAQGFLVVNAVTGAILFREESLRPGLIIPVSPENAEFICLSEGSPRSVSFLGLDIQGRLETKARRTLAQGFPEIRCGTLGDKAAILGTGDGRLIRFERSGAWQEMASRAQTPVRDIALSGDCLSFLIDSGGSGSPGSALGSIPADYRALRSGAVLRLRSIGSYGALVPGPRGEGEPGFPFLLWQPESSDLPLLLTLPADSLSLALPPASAKPAAPAKAPAQTKPAAPAKPPAQTKPAAPAKPPAQTKPAAPAKPPVQNESPGEPGIPFGEAAFPGSRRYPLQALSTAGDKTLFLDSAGRIAVLNTAGEQVFSCSAPGAMDAAFLDGENLIIPESSAIAGGPNFTLVNLLSGETVPLTFPGDLGLRVCPGGDGTIYGALIKQSAAGISTSLIAFHRTRLQDFRVLLTYPEEDTRLGMAWNGGVFAATLGDSGAFLCSQDEAEPNLRPLERSAGLPLRLISGKDCFILSDTEGNITWQDPLSGRILATLKVYDTEWVLEKPGEGILRGKIAK